MVEIEYCNEINADVTPITNEIQLGDQQFMDGELYLDNKKKVKMSRFLYIVKNNTKV